MSKEVQMDRKRRTYSQGLKIRLAATKVAEAAFELIQTAPDEDVVEWANKVADEAVAIASASYLRNL